MWIKTNKIEMVTRTSRGNGARADGGRGEGRGVKRAGLLRLDMGREKPQTAVNSGSTCGRERRVGR
ncbi:hypothetical protein SERLA73DRAFT_179831 [Serpula lacrymans var. lacrymans S7.3]|uniref:Uncharacterized protein n=2 Tax=Serpula lacrymans var. lacrymans TaxID=341189 RepID=F8PUH3_SERL3|nr:uncharacterized protein SERLADRAFT_465125 [Serpula lacrymans var. lacrymans S7.9]EGN99693.1 hypothetical protein SERLA73DRAFT_179831 [Serpula lacrymans var. lacrymans S7.3]EGO25253.1 hypothetical protein SERLADRAFT_465125 [Serpula lacrymans var. lacrymans S7.9]